MDTVNDSVAVYQKTAEFISAEELVAMRKGSKEDVALPPSVGPKLAAPSESWLEEKALQCVLDDYKESLSQKRGARICDLMQAVWDEDMNAAITTKLKGKFVQHMGRSVDGRILLSPEEAFFLVENGCLEVEEEGRTLSTEEACSTMLKGCLDRYRVYSHLSQFGFIVVTHNASLKANKSQKKLTSDKEKKRKRSTTSPLPENQTKRLNFTGAFAEEKTKSESSCDPDKGEADSLQAAPEKNSPSVNLCDSTTSPSAEISAKSPEPDSSDPSRAAPASSDAELSQLSNEQFEKDDRNDTKNVNEQNLPQVSDSSSDCQFVESCAEESSVKRNEQVSNHSVEKQNTDSQDYIEVTDEDYEKLDEGFSAEPQEPQTASASQEKREEDQECVSFSSDSPSSSSDSDDDLEIDEAGPKADDEVTLLEITKKETTPLAVIDLLSDDENQVEDESEDGAREEEDIEVVQVCNNKVQDRKEDVFKAPLPIDNIKSRKLSRFKSEQPACENGRAKPTIYFPNCLNKELVCVPRPTVRFLPLHVQPHKEAYILDIPKMRGLPPSERTVAQPTRVWNSYRDMQEYQRSRRRHHNRPHFRQHSRNNNRPYPNHHPDESFSRNHWQPPPDPPLQWGGGHRNSPRNPLNDVIAPDQKPPLWPNASPISYESLMEQRGIPPQYINSPSPQPSLLGMPPMSPMGGFPPISPHSNFINEVQRTAYTYARNMISSMFGPNFDLNNLPCPLPPPTAPSPNPLPMVPPPINQWNGSHHDRRGGHRRPHAVQFPGGFRSLYNKRSWSEVRAAVEKQKAPQEDPNDIQEIPISAHEFLWSTGALWPLFKPQQHTLDPAVIVQTLRRTERARMTDKNNRNEKYFPDTPTLEIAYDVYLPGTPFKKSCPPTPKYRIVVVRATDPLPRLSDIARLQRLWCDGAQLELALVDNADVSFCSFDSVMLPDLIIS